MFMGCLEVKFYVMLLLPMMQINMQTETQHSSIDRENVQESIKIEQNGSRKAVQRKNKETEDDATLAKAIKVMERPVDYFQIFGDYSYLIRKKDVPYQQHRFRSRLYLQYMTQVAQIHSLFIHCSHTIIPILINFTQGKDKNIDSSNLPMKASYLMSVVNRKAHRQHCKTRAGEHMNSEGETTTTRRLMEMKELQSHGLNIGMLYGIEKGFFSEITPDYMVFVTLRYLATGSFLQVIGDVQGMDKRTASKVVSKVIKSLAVHFKELIKMAKRELCIGALDCTHIKIKSPGGADPENYRNRNGFFSYNVQVLKIKTAETDMQASRYLTNVPRGSPLCKQNRTSRVQFHFLLGIKDDFSQQPEQILKIKMAETDMQASRYLTNVPRVIYHRWYTTSLNKKYMSQPTCTSGGT
ncbi:unnamed protein product [Acanthoscelides obtectus]|uniref:DDE Tnp4 domain-containing protein n=1 Tax=Acanthoscelides obtectus TaxID=200917 RepID=A0A9P0JZ13_ACAOB|nr:unnamed protein product [Acanthoscelides obtectus]CAK1633822.1 Putative nuclease HARBI1 [Acanthoscelides obtectus]